MKKKLRKSNCLCNIKKQWMVIMLLMAFLITAWPVGSTAAQSVTVMLDDVKLDFDVAPVLDNGRVLVPFRAVFQAIGAQVEWEQESKTVTAITRKCILQLSVDQKTASINGDKMEMSVPVRTINTRTMVPVRFVAEALGAQVDWQAKSQTVVIKKTTIKGVKLNFDKWIVSYIRNGRSDGRHRDLYSVTDYGMKNLLVVEDIPLDYAWNPAGDSVALDQNVLLYGAGTANPCGTWVKDLVSGRETLVSYPSGVMGPAVEAIWLDEKRLLTSQGTTAPEARAVIVDVSSGEKILEFPRGFKPLGTREDGFLGVLRKRENWGEANLSLWKPGEGFQILVSERASNFSLDPKGQKVAWLGDSDSKCLEGTSYHVGRVKIYHLDSGRLQTYPVRGHEVSWSPDGCYLVIPAGDKLQILEVASGVIVRLDDYNDYPGGSFAWRPDSKKLAWEKKVSDENDGQRIELWYWQAESEDIGPLFTPRHNLNREPAWSPDGTSLLYVAGQNEPAGVYLWDAQSDTHHPLTREKKELLFPIPVGCATNLYVSLRGLWSRSLAGANVK